MFGYRVKMSENEPFKRTKNIIYIYTHLFYLFVHFYLCFYVCFIYINTCALLICTMFIFFQMMMMMFNGGFEWYQFRAAQHSHRAAAGASLVEAATGMAALLAAA